MSKMGDSLRVDLKEYVERLLVAIEKRLDAINEWRDALKDAQSRSPTRDEVDVRFCNVEAQLKELNRFKDEHRGSASQSDVNEVRLLAVIGTLVAIISVVMRFLGM